MSDKLYTYQEAFVPTLRRVEGFDIPIPMPEMPPFEEMENYYLPRDEQVFKTTIIPKNLRSLEKAREREIVSREWHKRINGVWMFIDGEPIYIPGRAYMFFNYWYTEAGTLPDFRWEALEFFWVWDYVWNSKVDYGLLIVKCRRLGDSEKSKFLLWETATRYRKAWCGMQHMKEDDAKDSFSDIVTANQQMVYFFKPVSNGNDDPKGALEFKYPTAREGLNSLKAKQRSGNKETEAGTPALNSKINYETTKLKRYDGKRLTLYHMDEYGKMEIMNAVKQWGIIKPALSLHGGTVIVGKAIFTSTVEELGTGECLENAKELWDTSNPADRNAQGSTTSGLLRYFRTAKLAATVDKFGKHQSDKVVQMVNDTVKDLMKNGRHDRVSEYKRKMPLNIEDVFITRAEDCDLLPYKLDERLQQIEMGIGWDGSAEKINIKRVSLIWRNGHFGTEVISVPDESGRWYMSQEPTMLNASDWSDGYRKPENTGAYSSGADPIDHRTTNGRGSKGSFTVYRKYDRAIDGHLGIKGDDGTIRFPDSAMPKMLTDQFVCSYTYRPDNPVEFYEDYLKTLIYYGCQGLIEMNKPGLANWLIEKGYRGYVQTRPSNTRKNPHQRNKGEDLGASATEEVIGHYINALKDHIARRIGSCKHAEIIKDWRQFQYANRTIRDLSVASGFNLLGAADPRYISVEEEKKEEWAAPWQPHAAIF